MEHLGTSSRLKIKDFVDKLQKLEYTLLGNKEDSWIMELLFTPGLHRCHLLEWILSKLGCDTGKIFDQQSSDEERMKTLQSTFSQLGVCWPDSIIKGTAQVEDQLKFWCQLIDINWLKHEIRTNNSASVSEETSLVPERKDDHVFVSPGMYSFWSGDMSVSISPSFRCSASGFDGIKRKCIGDDEFEKATSLIHKICESGNLKHLFKHDIQLVSPDVQREIENLSPSNSEIYNIPSLEEFKKSAKENSDVKVMGTLSQVPCDEEESDHLLERNQLEKKLSEVCFEFSDTTSSFINTSNDYKPLILKAKTEPFTDVGPDFQKLESDLEKLIKLKNSFSQLQSSSSKLLKLLSVLEESYENVLSDEKHASILDLVKDDKEN